MGIENLIGKLTAAVLPGEADTAGRGLASCPPTRPIATYPATYLNVSVLNGSRLRHGLIGLRAFSLLHTCAGARAHARARTVAIGENTSQTYRPNFPLPADVTLLKHCRCADCGRSRAPAGSSLACPLPCVCRPQPDEWHCCAEYHGPQISQDVWAWPRRRGEATE